MNEKNEDENERAENEEIEVEDDDLKAYLEEMSALESDFSDLEDLDIEELQEIQDAIAQVKESEETSEIALANENVIEENISLQDTIDYYYNAFQLLMNSYKMVSLNINLKSRQLLLFFFYYQR